MSLERKPIAVLSDIDGTLLEANPTVAKAYHLFVHPFVEKPPGHDRNFLTRLIEQQQRAFYKRQMPVEGAHDCLEGISLIAKDNKRPIETAAFSKRDEIHKEITEERFREVDLRSLIDDFKLAGSGKNVSTTVKLMDILIKNGYGVVMLEDDIKLAIEAARELSKRNKGEERFVFYVPRKRVGKDIRLPENVSLFQTPEHVLVDFRKRVESERV